MKTTKKQEKALVERVLEWQRRLSYLGIGHYRTVVTIVGDDVNFIASSRTNGRYSDAEFRFSPAFWEQDEQRQEEVIVHEWLHIAFYGLDEAIEVAESWMPEHTWADYDLRVEHERESLVDNLARLIVANVVS